MSMPASSMTCSNGVPSTASNTRPSTVTRTIFLSVKFASAPVDFRPRRAVALVLHAILKLDETVEHSLGTGRASGNVKRDRHHAIDSLQDCVVIVRTAGTGARAE